MIDRELLLRMGWTPELIESAEAVASTQRGARSERERRRQDMPRIPRQATVCANTLVVADSPIATMNSTIVGRR